MEKVGRIAVDITVALSLAAMLLLVYNFELDESVPSKPPDTHDVSETSETIVEFIPSEPLKLAVTAGGFDDMGKLLAALGDGYSYTVFDEQQLSLTDELTQFDGLFLTCAEPQELENGRRKHVALALRAFVRDCGTLYASDLRFDIVAEAFPDYADATAVAHP